jgi:nicotinate dehydrogenase subunit A
MATRIGLVVNGTSREVTVDDPATPLLYVLRDELGLHGPHYGCGLAQCGACTVHVDGAVRRSCVVPVESVAGRAITTLEGLGTPADPHVLQTAFIEEQAVQCGYCANGMLMTAAALLKDKPRATDAEISEALANNLCRCGTHARIVKAVARAAGRA